MRSLGLLLLLLAPSCAKTTVPLLADDFRHGLSQWRAELEHGGTVEARDGWLDIDVPAGCTVWFTPLIEGPVVIESFTDQNRPLGPDELAQAGVKFLRQLFDQNR